MQGVQRRDYEERVVRESVDVDIGRYLTAPSKVMTKSWTEKRERCAHPEEMPPRVVH